MGGIAKAKTEGVYMGRKPSEDPAEVKVMQDERMRPFEITEDSGWRAPPRGGRSRDLAHEAAQLR